MKKTGGTEVTLNSMGQNPVPLRKPNTPEQNTIEPEPKSSAEESEVAKSSSNFPIVYFKDYDIAKKSIHFIQINHVIDKP